MLRYSGYSEKAEIGVCCATLATLKKAELRVPPATPATLKIGVCCATPATLNSI
jgi:hypothetical protein